MLSIQTDTKSLYNISSTTSNCPFLHAVLKEVFHYARLLDFQGEMLHACVETIIVTLKVSIGSHHATQLAKALLKESMQSFGQSLT